MQHLYAFKQCRKSNFQLALDQIEAYFQPDLNSMEVQDKNLLNSQKEIAQKIFINSYQTPHLSQTEAAVEPKVKGSIEKALNFYQQHNKKDAERLKKEVLDSVDLLYDRYLLLLKLLVELSDFVQIEYSETKRKVYTKKIIFEHELKFSSNKILIPLKKDAHFKEELSRRNLKWNQELIRQWYKLLVKDETYLAYRQLPSADFQQDSEIVHYIFKEFILKNDVIQSYFESEDINWVENRAILRGIVMKTLKAITENSEIVSLFELSPNWEDDRDFFKELFYYTIKHGEEHEAKIAEKVENWDVDRITAIDRVLLEMALCEMICFPSIPVKVTINEYIELSKIYSTPQSNIFINGVLDSISQEYLKEGKIKKSARGLLDNK
ncbi:transcription antitermination factor NusB [Thermoflexibacter ruber]|uniref:NusB antitermination factor n=1 Tax=Thermoflexibacter ruber TaxID=1003 RepID=A0A1I2B731_9BACT|nr:transcription antitermination factor NusB [Thermoflexibacter ruber]SFE50960.1 NusB antitermination factor [Thermoflexibacter ruber]